MNLRFVSPVACLFVLLLGCGPLEVSEQAEVDATSTQPTTTSQAEPAVRPKADDNAGDNETAALTGVAMDDQESTSVVDRSNDEVVTPTHEDSVVSTRAADDNAKRVDDVTLTAAPVVQGTETTTATADSTEPATSMEAMALVDLQMCRACQMRRSSMRILWCWTTQQTQRRSKRRSSFTLRSSTNVVGIRIQTWGQAIRIRVISLS